MTYAVITSDSCEGIDEGIIEAIINGEEYPDDSWNFGYDETDVLFFAYKYKNDCIVQIDRYAA